jgi:hypothetical protein
VPVAAAPTAGAIGRALGPGTSDQEKVCLRQKSSFAIIILTVSFRLL